MTRTLRLTAADVKRALTGRWKAGEPDEYAETEISFWAPNARPS